MRTRAKQKHVAGDRARREKKTGEKIMAELRELSVKQFVEDTASKASVPGGGSVSALVGALGATLMEMVANLTIGKEKYAGVQEEMQVLAAEGAALHEELLAGIK